MSASAIVVLALLLAVPALWLISVSLYLLTLTILSWDYRGPQANPDDSLRFLLLVPAHNEAGGIADMLATAETIDWPRGQFTIAVIADNCTDDTAARARARGAQVFERHDPAARGKGQALDWFIKTEAALIAAHDVVVMVDADMRIDSRLLRAFAEAFAWETVQVAQALNTVSEPARDWRSALGFASFQLVNHVRPAGRCALGGTGELKGSGMAFRSPVLERYGWPAHGVTEDIEFSKRLLLDGIRVHYVPRARVTSPIPETHAQAAVQQQRWESGKLGVLQRYAPVFIGRLRVVKHPRYLDALLDALVPPMSLYVVGIALVGTLGALVHPVLPAAMAGSGAVLAVAVATGLVAGRAPLATWLYLGAAPLFVAWKLPLLAGAALRRGGAWQRTPRREEAD